MNGLYSKRIGWTIGFLLVLGATLFSGATEHVPALVLRLGIALAVLAFFPTPGFSVRLRDLVAPGLALLILLANVPFAVSLGAALQAMVTSVLVVALYVALLAAPRDWTAPLFWLALGVGWVHAVAALVQWLGLSAQRGAGGFFDPNDLAAFLAPLFVWCLSQLLFGRKTLSKERRWVLLSSAAMLLLGLLATRSRAGFLAAGCGALMLTFWVRRRATVLVLVVLVALALLVPGIRQRWLGEHDAYAYARANIYGAALQIVTESPLGVGLGGAVDALRQQGVPLSGLVRYPKHARHAHSEVLNAWVELGPWGLVATLLPPLFLFWVIVSRRRSLPDAEQKRALAQGLALLLCFAIPALVATSLHVRVVAFLAVVFAAAEVRRDPRPGRRCHFAPPTRAKPILAAVLGLALFLALLGTVSSVARFRAAALRDAGQIDEAYWAAQLSARTAPWSLGAKMLVLSLTPRRGQEPDQVVAQLIALAEAYPTKPQPLDRAAQLLEMSAATPDAWRKVAALRQAQVLRDPKNALARVTLARAQQQADQTAEARKTLEEALQLEPHCARALVALALIEQQDDPARAAQRVAQARAAHAKSSQFRGYARQVLSLGPQTINMLEGMGPTTP